VISAAQRNGTGQLVEAVMQYLESLPVDVAGGGDAPGD